MVKSPKTENMKNTIVTLVPLTAEDRESSFLTTNWAFKYGAMEEFGMRDDHLEEDGEIISRGTIERSIDVPDSGAYRIVYEGKKVVWQINQQTHYKHLQQIIVKFSHRAFKSINGFQYVSYRIRQCMRWFNRHLRCLINVFQICHIRHYVLIFEIIKLAIRKNVFLLGNIISNQYTHKLHVVSQNYESSFPFSFSLIISFRNTNQQE